MSQPPTMEPPDPQSTEPPSTPVQPGIPPPPPIEAPRARRRWPFVVVAVVAIVAIVGGVSAIVSGSSGSGGSFSAHGVSFTYPSDWQDLGAPTYQAQSGSTIWGEGFAPKPGTDIVSVTAYTVSSDVAADDADQQQQLLDRVFSGLVSSQNGTVTAAMHATQLGGQPAFAVSFTLPQSSGDLFTDDTIRIDGTTEYLVTCQYHDATKAQITPGCQQVLSSFSTG